jgi:hypothetical protein
MGWTTQGLVLGCDAVGMGTDAWRNWNAFNEQNPETENADDELYSDRHFVGGPSTYGPYSLAVILRLDRPETTSAIRPAVRVRVGVHANLVPDVVRDGKLVPANSDAYHGGGVSDEIAALVSLTLGVRLRVAGTSRLSGIHRQGEEQPSIYLEVAPLASPGRLGREYIPAALHRPADLGLLDRLDSFPDLDEEAQVELVRAARAYATGLWWSNEDQNQAWLQFVTAVEIAANHRQKVRATPQELVEDLCQSCGRQCSRGGRGARRGLEVACTADSGHKEVHRLPHRVRTRAS